jgi:alkanesulfonate monooxygenase SsuD/methylene tetrahydromethanopterin reductase-like flavin-dependent oxidoreductase (luciferase family)
VPPHRRSRTLHLAAAIGGDEGHGLAYYRDMARLAEGGGLDFVTLELDPGGGAGLLDALALLAGVAPVTDRIGVVPSVSAAGAEPLDVAAAVATLDWVSRGRAGWTLEVAGARPAARRRQADRSEALWRAAGDTAGAVAGMWGGTSGPRPAQGPGAPARTPVPVTALDATERAARGVAARHADVAFVRAARPEGAGRIRAELHRLAAAAGRDPDRLLVLADLVVDFGGGEVGPEPGVEIALVPDATGRVLFRGGPVDLAELIADWHRQDAVDGFHVRPVEPRRDLERFVNGTAALLQHRGLFRAFHPGATLREHLGLHRPASRPAVHRGALS